MPEKVQSEAKIFSVFFFLIKLGKAKLRNIRLVCVKLGKHEAAGRHYNKRHIRHPLKNLPKRRFTFYFEIDCLY